MNKKFAHIMAAIVMLIWAMSYISIKVVVAEINPVVSAFYRFLASSIILYGVLKIKFPEEKILKEDRIKMILGGLFGVTLYFIFENFAVLYTSASNVAVLIACIPVLTVISQRIIFGEKLTLRKVTGTTISVLGIVIIVASKGNISLFSKGAIGDLMTLAAAISWVLYNIINTKIKGKYKSITVTTYQFIWGSIFLSPSMLFYDFQVPSLKVSLNLLYLAVFCSCIGFALYIYSLNKLGATVLTTYINLQPIITVITAAVILKESISKAQIWGSFIIIIGVLLVSLNGKVEKMEIEETKAL